MNFCIRYNHVGYLPSALKEFLFSVDPEKNSEQKSFSFELLADDGSVAYRGNLKPFTQCNYTNEFIWIGDFTAFTTEGHYFLAVKNGDGNICSESKHFRIAKNLAEVERDRTLESFYFQRSGVKLSADRAGKWARPAAHLDDHLKFHTSMNRDGTWNAHGGWYDAGDYGKYIVNGGVSVATLMVAAECTEKKSRFYSRLLEEIRFELEFFLRMQDYDGGVFFKISPSRWDNFVTPTLSDLKQERRILGKSTTSALNFAGALAQAHCVFAADSSFSEKCLQAALRAYDWALKNPAVNYPQNTEGSGSYSDEHFDDEFFWARAMLFREFSNEGPLKTELLLDMQKNTPLFGLDWRNTQNLGWIALALQSKDSELQKKARETMMYTANEILKLAAEDAYGLSIRKFIWGSNGDIANHALTLFLVNSWCPKNEYVETARKMLDFIYGKNPVDRCFVTGAAWSSPKFIHHRISHSDGIDEPIPGLVAGGINQDRQDLYRFPHYPSELPGFSYADERCSFASNEVAINWNAPLVAALSFC